jgi:hypothetical protein
MLAATVCGYGRSIDDTASFFHKWQCMLYDMDHRKNIHRKNFVQFCGSNVFYLFCFIMNAALLIRISILPNVFTVSFTACRQNFLLKDRL